MCVVCVAQIDTAVHVGRFLLRKFAQVLDALASLPWVVVSEERLKGFLLCGRKAGNERGNPVVGLERKRPLLFGLGVMLVVIRSR